MENKMETTMLNEMQPGGWNQVNVAYHVNP